MIIIHVWGNEVLTRLTAVVVVMQNESEGQLERRTSQFLYRLDLGDEGEWDWGGYREREREKGKERDQRSLWCSLGI